MKPPFEILYEDNHLLAVNKPPGIPTMGVAPGVPSVLELARQYIKERYQKPGNVYLGIVSRLDAPVTGVLLLARTSKAAARLTEQFREHRVEKTYWAMVEGIVEPPEAECVLWMAHDERHRRMHVVGPTAAGAQQAILRYRRLQTSRNTSLLEVELQTGRKHQIRVQLSDGGWPIIGDYKYGSRRKFEAGIALHARRLMIQHPTRGEAVELVAAIPQSWRIFDLSQQDFS